jgi:hypothetical protein
VTRTLKEFGDQLEKRLLPSPARPHMAPPEAASALAVLRCVALLIQLTGPYIGRFLPQVHSLQTGFYRVLPSGTAFAWPGVLLHILVLAKSAC